MPRSLFSRATLAALALLAGAGPAPAIPLTRATFTEVVNHVSIIDPATRKSRPANRDGIFATPEVLRTGAESRAELIAEDRTVTRVGANTLFSFASAGRAIDLQRGSILFQSPSGKGGGSIRTPAASAAVLGTTMIVSATREGAMKVLLIEGTGKVLLPGGATRILHAGQMLTVRGCHFSAVLDFRIRELAANARLIKGFRLPLPSQPKIVQAERVQMRDLAQGRLAPRGEGPPPRNDGNRPPPQSGGFPPPGEQGGDPSLRPPPPPPPPIMHVDSTAVQVEKEQKSPPPQGSPQGQPPPRNRPGSSQPPPRR